MKNHELRKELYELLGETIIMTSELIDRHLMNRYGEIGIIITEIYSCLSRLSDRVEKEVDEEGLTFKTYSLLKEKIEEHFSIAFITAESVEAEIPLRDIENRTKVFTSLISFPSIEAVQNFPNDMVFD